MSVITISELQNRYHKGELSPSVLIQELWPRLEKGDPAIWIYRISRETLDERAKELESQSALQLPLYGIPFAVKDNFDVAGCPTTAGCPDFSYLPDAHAKVVELLLSAGAILIGKTNMDQFATGLVGTRSPYGVPENAFDPLYIPGGSSSGSAVAVAKGMVSFSLGTDTAGSGRVPASFNNLIGFKPTRGKLSCRGVVPACRSLDCVSIFGLQARDIEAVLSVLGQWDPEDPYCRKEKERPPSPPSDKPRVALLKEDQLEFFDDSHARHAYEKGTHVLKACGLETEPVDLSPFLKAAELLYSGPWVAERYLATSPLIEDSPDSLWPETYKIISQGNNASARETFHAQYNLAELRRKSDEILDTFDFLALPTTGSVYTLEEVSNDPIDLNSNLGRYTNFMNLLDLCGCAVPTAFREDGLPAGMTLFAPAFDDRKVLSWVGEIHRRAQTGAGLERNLQPKSALVDRGPSTIDLFVCGSHMTGLPLNPQLRELGGQFLRNAETAPHYRMFLLSATEHLPERPGLVRWDEKTACLPGEIWRLPLENFGAFMLKIRYPLGISQVKLKDGEMEYGFCCDSAGLDYPEITDFKGWRSFLSQRIQN